MLKLERMSDDWKTASYIRSNEIEDYTYCNQQWFLKRVEGIRPAPIQLKRMDEGTRFHEQHWQEVKKAARQKQVVFALVAAAVTLLILYFLLEFAP